VQHYGKAKTSTSIKLFPNITDPQNFDKTIEVAYKFAEDKEEIRAAVAKLK